MKSLSSLRLLVPLMLLLLLCGSTPAVHAARSSFAYHWPLKPFDRQHPVRGAFGDPRTRVRNRPFTATRPGETGSFSFHNGIDIVAAPGTPVYPVTNGRVVFEGAHSIIVRSWHERAFFYWHLRDNVTLGQKVVAERTILGWIRAPFDHVHFAELDDHQTQNPLAAGHLEPYADHTTPRATALRPENGSLAIEAVDAPAMRAPGLPSDLPQAPALVEWRLRSSGDWSRWHVVADFRHTTPTAKDFWVVYMAGTYQNSPYKRIAGRYLFRTRLEPSLMAPGSYRLEARVVDIRGNSSTTTWPIEVP